MEINIEGLTRLRRLQVGSNPDEIKFLLKNLPSLTWLSLAIYTKLDEKIITQIVEQLHGIEELYLFGNFSFFNLDNFVNLKKLMLNGTIKEDFNFELFKKICIQLEELYISSSGINNKILFKLFDGGHHFSNLLILKFEKCNITVLKKKFIDQFPMIQKLYINHCNLEKIEDNALSKLKKLTLLNLCDNCINKLDKSVFSELTNLNFLLLDKNPLKKIEKNLLTNLKKLILKFP